MNRTPVSSSMIASVGYDPNTKTLEIEFKSKSGPNAIWQYSNVPYNVYANLLGAESVGKEFIANVKGNYSESRI